MEKYAKNARFSGLDETPEGWNSYSVITGKKYGFLTHVNSER
jgi:hypothetical protein